MDKTHSSPLDKKTELSEIVSSYTKHWKWFALSVFICLVVAFLYLRYATPIFSASAQIQVLDENAASSELGVFRELEIFTGGNKTKVQDEIDIFKSRSNFIEVAKQLGLNIRMTVLGKIADTEIYNDAPVNINFIPSDSIVEQSKFSFFLDLSSETQFGHKSEENESFKSYVYGKQVSTPIGNMVITPNDNFKRYKNENLRVDIMPIHEVGQNYMKKIKVSMKDEFSNVLSITITDPNQDKAVDILNALINTYNNNAIADKKAVADKTSLFIDDRIADIYSDLSSVDQSAEDFRTDRGIADIASQSNINLNVSATGEQELRDANIQLNIASSMRDLIETQENFDIIPSNIGLSDPSIANAAAKYNQLVAERNRLLKSSNEKNPVIVNLDEQLRGLKRTMQSSLNSVENNLNLQVNDLSKQLSRVNSRIYSAPKNERALRDITRKQQTAESLYLYLLQKREEAQISFASSAPKSKVIDWAYATSSNPVAPKSNIILLASLLFGLAIPFSILYTKDLLDSKVHNKSTLEKFIREVPVLGEIPRLKKNELKIINDQDRSVLAESLRILRTNLDYLIKSKKNKSKNNIIFVTSGVPGEGKTFVSSNLAMVLASTNKKVILIGADIRNPKIYSFFSGANVDKLSLGKSQDGIGLSEFLHDHSISLSDMINPMLAYSNTIDVVYSGKIPPNPAELLMSERLKELFDEVSEKYDYVIVDTAPLMVVSDTLLISTFADFTVYVTRSGMTERTSLEFPRNLQKEGKLNGLTFVVNGVKQSELGYGGRYGYGYGATVKKWWHFSRT